MMNVLDFQEMKLEKKKISMVTCYDFWSAKILNDSLIDCLLIGDSLSMVMHGFSSTVAATNEMMAFHVAAVAKGASEKFLIADMPFLSFRKGPLLALECVDLLVKAGANAVKLEGVFGHEDVIEQIVGSGVPVMGHLGLTPQSINGLGGFKVQGRSDDQAKSLMHQAKTLQALGCFSLVLECVPASLASEITKELQIPVIGIGAGVNTDGQVLVLQDLLGMSKEFCPKFLKKYLQGYSLIKEAVNEYDREIKGHLFPTEKESYL